MPATTADLLKVRQELNEKTPLLYQGELFDSFQWLKSYESKLIAPNTLNDLKLALMKEAIRIWDTQTYNIQNIKNVISDIGGWETNIFVWLVGIRKEKLKKLTTSTDILDKFINEKRASLPYIYEDYNGATAELETAKRTAEASLKEYKAKLGDKTPEALKADIDKLNTRPDISQDAYQNLLNNQEKHTPEQLEKHTAQDLKPADLPDNWKTELARIPDLDKRPTQEQLNQAVSAETDKYKDYGDIKAERDQLKIDNASKDTTISDRDHTIKDQKKVIDETKDLPDTIKDLNKQLSDKDLELGKRADTITSLTNEKTGLESIINQKNTDFENLVKITGEAIKKQNAKIAEQEKQLKDKEEENKKLGEQQGKNNQYLNKGFM